MSNQIDIRLLDAADKNAWDTFVATNGGGPMQWSAWLDVLSDAFAVEPHFLLARNNAGQVTGILPLYFGTSILTGRQLASMPDGILAANEQTAEALLAHALEEGSRKRAGSVVIRGGLPAGLHSPADLEVVHTVVDTLRPTENLWLGLKKKVRWAIRQHCALDFVERHGDADLICFHRLYSDHQRRLGTPAVGSSALSAMWRRLGDRMKLFVAMQNERMVAGMVVVRYGGGWSSIYAAQAAEARNSNVGYFLYWKVLEWMCENGVASFDLGRSVPGEGVHRFKRKWGGVDVTKLYGYYGPRGAKMASAASRARGGDSIAQQMWRRLPDSLARMAGPLVRRQFPFS